jgi:Fe-S cluster biogenesis protein NfuA
MSEDIMVQVQSTPNPNAQKYIVDRPVKISGKATFYGPREADGYVLVSALFDVEGVRQVHLFENVITVTHAFDVDEDEFTDLIISVIKTRLPVHNPDFLMKEETLKKEKSSLPPELEEIDQILDRTIRPGLQADGGDVDVVALNGKVLEISYMGACGGCPSSYMGTLDAIESILQHEYDPDIQVTIV